MDDQDIVQLYLDRDQHAIAETAVKYGNYCTSIAANILGNQEDAEECVNDTYLNAWNSIPPHRPRLLAAFLGKLTRNLSFNRYKKNRADKRGGGSLPAVLDELADCVSGSDSVDDQFEYQELVTAINEFLGALPAKKRIIFLRRYWFSDSVSDIADRFGMKENAVSMTLRRLRFQLRDHLTKRGFTL